MTPENSNPSAVSVFLSPLGNRLALMKSSRGPSTVRPWHSASGSRAHSAPLCRQARSSWHQNLFAERSGCNDVIVFCEEASPQTGTHSSMRLRDSLCFEPAVPDLCAPCTAAPGGSLLYGLDQCLISHWWWPILWVLPVLLPHPNRISTFLPS